MKNLRRPTATIVVLLFFLMQTASLPAQPSPGSGQSSAPAPAQPPPPELTPQWFTSQERIPKEVKDKEKETPTAWCTGSEHRDPNNADVSLVSSYATYFDRTTGTRTTITKTDRYSRTPGQPSRVTRTVWEIETSNEVTTTRKKITYELGGRRTETRTEQVGTDTPTTRPARESDLFDPSLEQPKRGSFLWPSHSHWLTNVPYRALPLRSMAIGQTFSSHSPAFVLAAAATQQRPSAQPTQETQEKPQHNMKIVALGAPLENPTVHFEPEPQTTPEEFVENPPMTAWDPTTDSPGPMTATPGPTGIPMTAIPFGWINIGSGWASARVHSSAIRLCSGGDDGANNGEGLPYGMKINYRDRGSTQVKLPDGAEITVGSNHGWINLPNGIRVNRWANGARTISRRNGFGMTFLPENGWGFTLPDRTRVTVDNRGTTVRLPDGKTITRRRDGKVVEERPDGTEAPWTGQTNNIKLPGGGTIDMSGSYTAVVKMPDGTQIHTLQGEGTHVTSPDGAEITALEDGQIILTGPGQAGIKMEKDGETIVNPLGPGEPTVRLKTNGMIDVVPFGGRIF